MDSINDKIAFIYLFRPNQDAKEKLTLVVFLQSDK